MVSKTGKKIFGVIFISSRGRPEMKKIMIVLAAVLAFVSCNDSTPTAPTPNDECRQERQPGSNDFEQRC